MKLIILSVFIFYIFTLSSQNLLHMDIENLTIYQSIKRSSFEIRDFGDKKDTIYIGREGERDSPFIDAVIKLKNISDSTITLHPNDSHIYIYYEYKDKQYRNEIFFYTKQILVDILIIEPKEEALFYSNGYFIKEGGSLDLITRSSQNTIDFLIAILPIFKIEYEDINGIKLRHQEIFNVKVAKNIEIGQYHHCESVPDSDGRLCK